MSTEIVTNEWQLNSLRIEFMTYGEFQGKYVGKVEFVNRTKEAFTFNISPEESQEYLNLVSKKLVNNASNLGDKLLKSLNLLPEPKTINVIAQD